VTSGHEKLCRVATDLYCPKVELPALAITSWLLQQSLCQPSEVVGAIRCLLFRIRFILNILCEKTKILKNNGGYQKPLLKCQDDEEGYYEVYHQNMKTKAVYGY
jgi:hypothetical protein